MLQKRGIIAVLLVLALFAALHLSSLNKISDPRTVGTTMLGGFAFLLMTTSLWLSTRPRFAESFFGGLDRMYQLHKFCGIFAGLLVLIHFVGVPKDLPAGADPILNPLVPSAPLGMIALVTLVLGLALALNRKVPYSTWRNPHKLMGVVYILACGHFLKAPGVFIDQTSPSIYMVKIAAVIGVISYLYSLFGMNRKTGKNYKIKEVNHLERATEMVLEASDDSEGFTFTPGQFAFVEVQGKGWAEPHPFTISSAPGGTDLRFTMKVLGDWTRKVREELTPGGDVIVRGPYGRFDTLPSGDKQIWLAGGIGITPFLSMVRAMEAGDTRHITLVYAVRELSEALFLKELMARAKSLPHFNLVVLESNKGEFAKVDIMKTKLSEALAEFNYFMCGPKPMLDALMKDLKAEGVPRASIHTEAFEFR